MAVKPTKESCRFAMAFQIERGSYGAVSLDGLGFTSGKNNGPYAPFVWKSA